MSMTTACPLDCYDACAIEYKDGVITPSSDRYTQGFLCPHLNHYESFERITAPTFRGEPISMDEAKERVVQMLKNAKRKLHFRSSGNMGLMQAVSDYVMANLDATLLEGSLCDGAGQAAISEGRGVNIITSPEDIAQSDVVIVWGRNLHVSNSHILPHVKGKELIVIDPQKTAIAKEAQHHIQIKPHGDIYLAMLLTRFLIINDQEHKVFCDQYATELEEYYELTQTVRIKAILEKIGVTLGDIGKVLEMVKDKKVTILVGVGVQKYRNGADVVRAIDAFGVALGLFCSRGNGVNFLGDSMYNITSPFHDLKAKRTPVVDVDFSRYDLAFIQGANPLAQLPDTNRVLESFKALKHSVYFGLYDNETSQACDLVIPACTFLEKSDVRASYGHHRLMAMPKVKEPEYGISEYDLMEHVANAFGVELQSESHYIEHFLSHGQMQDELLHVKGRDSLAYKDGFMHSDSEFLFMDEYDNEIALDVEDEYYLITCKAPTSLNSQFKRQNSLYLHPSLGIKSGERVRVSSINGSVELEVELSEDLRDDCVLIYSGTPGVNYLTSSKMSYDGKNAVYQENRVRIERI